MIDRCGRALLVAAAAYLALLPTGALSFWRSTAFATALACAIAFVAARRHAGTPPVALPDRTIPVAIVAWSAWSLASLAWSVDARYSLEELKPDVVWGVATLVVFYVAAYAAPRAFGTLAQTWLGALALWTGVVAGMELSWLGWDARAFHRGEGAFATYLVTAAPFLWLLAWPPPVGFRERRHAWVALVLLTLLLIATARLSENRIVWIALAVQAIVVAACAPRASRSARRTVVAVLLVVAFVALFADAARDRAMKVRPGDASVGSAIATDPRLAIWSHAFDHIRERPWIGYGYGLHILGADLGRDTGDAKIMHPHNLFISQWLQTGAIGALLLVTMFATIGARFVAFVRSRDDELARYGALGLAVLIGYVVRNFTDDFFIRANGKLLFAALAMLLAAGTLRSNALKAAAG